MKDNTDQEDRIHTVNGSKDGLTSFWRIAEHYGLCPYELMNINRGKGTENGNNAYELREPKWWLNDGDKVLLSKPMNDDRKYGEVVQHCPNKNPYEIRTRSQCHKQPHANCKEQYIADMEVVAHGKIIGYTDKNGVFKQSDRGNLTEVTVRKKGYQEKQIALGKKEVYEVTLEFDRTEIRSLIAETVKVNPRSEWQIIPGDINRSEEHWCFSMVAIHHAGDGGIKTLIDLEEKHINDNDWNEIGYHYIIDESGAIYEGSQIGYKGTHVAGNNSYKIGILFLGDYNDKGFLRGDHDTLDQSQIDACTGLVNVLKKYFPLTELGGHRDYELGEIEIYHCPGNLLYELLDDIRKETGLSAPALPNAAHAHHDFGKCG
ncbi:MAG: N-acetylmuramoyl-L-alanine amidase [Desulfobulbaceae bacterium]|nr:N-acetylmuramoyl-L-alanine amidase [Desulfobulbaceae bacterium]